MGTSRKEYVASTLGQGEYIIVVKLHRCNVLQQQEAPPTLKIISGKTETRKFPTNSISEINLTGF